MTRAELDLKMRRIREQSGLYVLDEALTGSHFPLNGGGGGAARPLVSESEMLILEIYDQLCALEKRVRELSP